MEFEIIYGDLPALGTERLVLSIAMVGKEEAPNLKLNSIFIEEVPLRWIR
ncbi:hypothetical protein [Neobacillus vireti]|nr:hypothetical protein [Neobacillus vireti]